MPTVGWKLAVNELPSVGSGLSPQLTVQRHSADWRIDGPRVPIQFHFTVYFDFLLLVLLFVVFIVVVVCCCCCC